MNWKKIILFLFIDVVMRGFVLSLLCNFIEKGCEVKEEENIVLRCDGCYKKNVEI